MTVQIAGFSLCSSAQRLQYLCTISSGGNVLILFCMRCNYFAYVDANIQVSVLTRAQQLPHAQVADGQPHDGGFVQVGGDIVWQRELVC